MALKKGLLIAPEFPADSFWSYKHVVHYVKRKATFPPLGLLTFAAQMPKDQWDLELIDLNVSHLPAQKLHQKIKTASKKSLHFLVLADSSSFLDIWTILSAICLTPEKTTTLMKSLK